MKFQRRRTAAGAALLLLVLGASAQTPTASAKNTEATMHHAQGTFTVKVALVNPPTVPGTGRFTIDKTFEGGIMGTSKGEMYSAGDYKTGNAGYVAIEVVTGKLDGKEGSFVLQHTGVMEGGKPSRAVRVVPGSGTGALAGIAGSFTITQTGGQHNYDLEYTLPQ